MSIDASIMPFFKRKKEEKEKIEENKKTEEKKGKVDLPQGKDPRFYQMIKKPIVTEKAVSFSQANKYIFGVSSRANKTEVRKAIEKLYEVKVKDVRMLNTTGKSRQVGRFEGWKPGFKKAIITLKDGYKIEITHT